MKPLHTTSPLFATMALSLFACGDATMIAQSTEGIHPEAAGTVELAHRAPGLASEIEQLRGSGSKAIAEQDPMLASAAAQLPPRRPADLEGLQQRMEELTGELFAATASAGGRTLLESEAHMVVFEPGTGELHLHRLDEDTSEADLQVTPEDLEIEAERLLGVLGIAPAEHDGPRHQTVLELPGQDGDTPNGTVRLAFQRHINDQPVTDHQVQIEFTASGVLLGIEAHWPTLSDQASNQTHTAASQGRDAAQALEETAQAAPIATFVGEWPAPVALPFL